MKKNNVYIVIIINVLSFCPNQAQQRDPFHFPTEHKATATQTQKTSDEHEYANTTTTRRSTTKSDWTVINEDEETIVLQHKNGTMRTLNIKNPST